MYANPHDCQFTYVNLREGISLNQNTKPSSTDNIIQDFKNALHCAHNERTDKIVVYFRGRRFDEIPIVL